MAIAISNPLFRAISGRFGNVVFYSRESILCVRSYVIPRNPDTQAQRTVRRTFAGAVKAWQALAREEKHIYNRRARYLNMSGYNMFISRYMKVNLPASESMTKAHHGITRQRAIPSVSCPFPLHNRILHNSIFSGTGT